MITGLRLTPMLRLMPNTRILVRRKPQVLVAFKPGVAQPSRSFSDDSNVRVYGSAASRRSEVLALKELIALPDVPIRLRQSCPTAFV